MADAPSEPRATILVIDDDRALARAMGRTLAGRGHTVHLAHDGREGLRMFRAEPPDLVIVDMVMPERDGVEVITQIQATAGAPPIIAISAGGSHVLVDLLGLARALGAAHTLRKPFRLETLAELAGALLRPGRAPRPPPDRRIA